MSPMNAANQRERTSIVLMGTFGSQSEARQRPRNRKKITASAVLIE